LEQPLDGAYAVTLRIVYLDQGHGTWSAFYDAIEQPEQVAISVTNADTGRWKEQVITLTDGYFGNRAGNASDIVLAHVAGEDTTFHMLELTRTTGDNGENGER
jgi:hypothetical protein